MVAREQEAIAQGGAGPAKLAALELPSCDDTRLFDIGMFRNQYATLTAADELGVFPLLAERSATADEVAERLALSPRATQAALGVLTALGFLLQRDARFYLTDVSRN